MSTNNFLIVSAIVALLFGVGLLFVPTTIIEPYMVNPEISPSMEILGRAYGTSLVGIALMFWTARKAYPSIARKAILIGAVTANILVGIIHILWYHERYRR